jgi:hypothetical protein
MQYSGGHTGNAERHVTIASTCCRACPEPSACCVVSKQFAALHTDAPPPLHAVYWGSSSVWCYMPAKWAQRHHHRSILSDSNRLRCLIIQ